MIFSKLLEKLNISELIAKKYLDLMELEHPNDLDSILPENYIQNLYFQFNNKSIEIIKIENHLNINLFKIKEKDFENIELKIKLPINNYYLVNGNNKIIGLNLSNNNISDLTFLKNFNTISTLIINSNNIESLSVLEDFKKLERLSVNKNNISNLEPISKITTLLVLDATDNKIIDISYLNGLKNLYLLNISNNKIIDITPLQSLTNLMTVNLENNNISDISEIKNLHEVAYNFQNNKISVIPDSFFIREPLKNSSELHDKIIHYINVSLQQKQIKTEFINEILELQKNVYALSDSKIESKHLKKIDKIYRTYFLDIFSSYFLNNPISSPPLEIIFQGLNPLFRYFERRDMQEKDFIHEAKVTLVGEGNAGKTSLQARLLNEKSDLPKNEERTRGIDVVEYNFEKYKAHIWDFGGQDIYYPVHRFFLTNDSVYILVASTRSNMHNFEYWIPTIYQFGGNSPIIIIQNCFNGVSANWNNTLSVFYSNPDFNILKPYSKINLPNNNFGLDGIKNLIQESIKKLPLIGKEVVKSWVFVRDEIIKSKDITPCLSFEDFKNLCKKTDINNNTKFFNNEIEIIDLGKFLHKLGVILWFDDRKTLKDYIVLKPEWLMNAVYFILDNEKSEKGYLTSSDFKSIWADKTYIYRHEFLKTILEEFKIAFPKKQRSADYILPSKLKSLPDGSKWEINNLNKYIRLEYEFNFIPYGLINQISADLSKYIPDDDSVWFNAVNILKNNSSAQIEENRIAKILYIKAKGNDARDLVAIIMKSVDDVIEEYRGISPKIQVLCNCDVCINLENPMSFNYDKIKEWLESGKDEKTCLESDIKINLRNLIDNAGFDFVSRNDMIKIIKENENMKNNKTIKISPVFHNTPHFEQNNLNSNINNLKVEINNIPEFKEIQELLLDLKEEAIDNKLWQTTLIECLDSFNRLEYAEDKAAQKTSISIIERGFKKLKDIKDVVAIGFLTVDIQKKFPELIKQWELLKTFF